MSVSAKSRTKHTYYLPTVSKDTFVESKLFGKTCRKNGDFLKNGNESEIEIDFLALVIKITCTHYNIITKFH